MLFLKSHKLLAVLVALTLTGTATVFAIIFNLFGPPELYETGKHPLDLVVSDLNSDGYLDVATANRDGRSVSIFMGNGDGTLTKISDIETGAGATSLTAGDINSDGKVDLAVTTCENMCERSNVLLYSGVGNGTFESLSEIAVEGVAYNVLLGDFNEDGLLDVAASDYPKARIVVLLSSGEIGQYSELSLPTGNKTIAVLSADFNQDQHLDLISSDHGDGTSSVYLGNGNGDFSERIIVETGKLPYSIALADINSDQVPDLLVAHSTKPGKISVHLGKGDGTFIRYTDFRVDDRLIYIDSADFNDDGLKDIIFTRHQKKYASVYLNRGDSFFTQTSIPVQARNNIYSLAVADLDNDKIPDLVTVDYDHNTLSVSLGGKLSEEEASSADPVQ